jgi:hypothetical protein
MLQMYIKVLWHVKVSYITLQSHLYFKLTISNSAWKGLKTTGYKCDFTCFVSVVKVPLLVEEMRGPSVGINWLKYLENKRLHLLQLVCAEQFRVTQSYVKSSCASQVELFPLHDVLEHRYCRPDTWGSEVARIGQKGVVFHTVFIVVS